MQTTRRPRTCWRSAVSSVRASCAGHSEFPNLAPGELQDVVCYARIFERV